MRKLILMSLLAVVSAVPGAGQVRSLTLDQLCQGSTRIVVGGVSKMAPRWEGTKIVTDVTLTLTETLKGGSAATLLVTIPGGTLNGITLRASEAPSFSVGEMVVLFVRPCPGACDVYGWYRGKFTVLGNQQIRELPNTTLAGLRADIQALVH